MSDRAEVVVRDYYDALRRGDPLEPYFRADGSTVKFGISEALFGYDEVADALREQTATTDEWTVESTGLVVDQRESFATFADEVAMAWTATDSGDRNRFETRWSGTLVPADDERDRDRSRNGDESNDREPTPNEDAPDWLFATMHVSTADQL